MEETKRKLKGRAAICVATLTAAGLSFGIVACGETEASGSSATGSGNTATAQGAPSAPPAGGTGVKLTDEEIKCLKDEGMPVPEGPPRGRNGDREAPGPPPAGGEAPGPPPLKGEAPERKRGDAPKSAKRHGAGRQGDPPDPEKMKAAAEACGVDAPPPPPPPPPASAEDGRPGTPPRDDS